MSTDLSIHTQTGTGEMQLSSPQFMPNNANSLILTFSSHEYHDRDKGGHFKVNSSVTIFRLSDVTAEGLHIFANMNADQRTAALDAMLEIKRADEAAPRREEEVEGTA